MQYLPTQRYQSDVLLVADLEATVGGEVGSKVMSARRENSIVYCLKVQWTRPPHLSIQLLEDQPMAMQLNGHIIYMNHHYPEVEIPILIEFICLHQPSKTFCCLKNTFSHICMVCIN